MWMLWNSAQDALSLKTEQGQDRISSMLHMCQEKMRVYISKYVNISGKKSHNSNCPQGGDPLEFCTICIYYRVKINLKN